MSNSRRDENKEKENLKTEIRDLHKRLQMQRNYTSELETMNQTLEEKNKNLIKVLDVRKDNKIYIEIYLIFYTYRKLLLMHLIVKDL